MPQQQLCARDMTVGGAGMQRGGPALIPRIHVCVVQEEELDDLSVGMQAGAVVRFEERRQEIMAREGGYFRAWLHFLPCPGCIVQQNATACVPRQSWH